MKLPLRGTGTPRPTVARQATANLLRIGPQNLLFDAGRGAATQLAHIGLLPRDLDVIFITHHHFDHIAALGDLLLSAWNDGRSIPIPIYGPPGTKALVETLFSKIYARDIAFRVKESALLEDYPLADITTLFPVTDLDITGDHVKTENWRVKALPVEHGHTFGLSQEEWPCLGYRIEAEGKILTISGDTIDCPNIRALARNADLLLQCCYMSEAEIDTPDKRSLATHVLASASQAAAIAKASKVKKMVLTHLSPKSGTMLKTTRKEASAGHNAEVITGADLMAFSI